MRMWNPSTPCRLLLKTLGLRERLAGSRPSSTQVPISLAPLATRYIWCWFLQSASLYTTLGSKYSALIFLMPFTEKMIQGWLTILKAQCRASFTNYPMLGKQSYISCIEQTTMLWEELELKSLHPPASISLVIVLMLYSRALTKPW